MEVASPLTFGPNNVGTKRQLSYSPGFVDSTNRSHYAVALDSSDDYVNQRSFKRRRFNMDVSMDGDSENSVNQSSYPMHATQQQKTIFPSSPNGQSNSSFKRCRTEASDPNNDVQRVVQMQAAEIDNLKHEKLHLESSMNNLKSEHETAVHENKILKKAVTIQQERQNHAASEIEAARQYKVEADDRIKKLEHIVLQLRYHLQTQQNPTNDFMGFRPPDVY